MSLNKEESGTVLMVSVIVPTLGRPELLNRCLDALAGQDLDRSRYEVVVGDDGASAGTRLLVESYGGRMDVRYVPVTGRHGPAAARNAALRVAAGEIVAFTDDDCIPHPGWLRAGTRAFVDGIEGASGRVAVPISSRPTDYEVNAALLASSSFVTANCFYRKSALFAAGGFDEDFTAPWREDSDLLFRLLAGQARLARAPEAVVAHPVRPAPWGVSIRQQKKSMFNALLYKKHPALYKKHIKPVHPWHYYGIVLALIVSVACALKGMGGASAAAASLWFAGTVLFCAHRLRGSSRAAGHVVEMAVTSALIPPLCIFWRLAGAIRYRVFFL